MSYFCHDCGTVIEEDDTNLCGKCAKKQHPTPMTNPAVEALKKIDLILMDVGRASSRDMLTTVVHIARKTAKEALAQAEQTPVGGGEDCPDCQGRGWYAEEQGGGPVQVQCESCLGRGTIQSPPPSGANPPGREAGRWVSEELFQTICEELEHCKHGPSDYLEEFRASPSFPKEGES